MANRYRGEVSAILDGRGWTLCLTLGALAELERAFQVDDMTALVERFTAGTLSARDAVRIIGAGLRGAGNSVDDDQVARMTADGGAAGFAAIVTDLLTVTFGTAEPETSDPS
ncbi:gene transfer agent family protein [Acuticoccus sp. MNP-M23]|uniref:gene transfer agent family protein n=1 Tax=Acuticoccus sp. MNP-M23 TaxID=3072793 RepID=UPI00281654F4|nr:gene transfer agent family protein [Acuticoccus sp. MNP-M23]WMS41697.1 gene transfer agent family protein [Acuticoccus sp. MNP-M23]